MGATTAVKSMAYKSLVRPLLEYACQVGNPHTALDKSVLEAIQRCAAKWACGSRWDSSSRRWNKSSVECLVTLHWPTLTQRRNYLSVSTLGDIFHKRTSLTFSDYYCFNASCTRAHELCVVPLQSSINCYRFSFFVNTASLWNSVPAHILNMNSIASFCHHFIIIFVHDYSCNSSCYCNYFVVVFLYLYYCYALFLAVLCNCFVLVVSLLFLFVPYSGFLSRGL